MRQGREKITGPGEARENKGCLSTPQFLSLVTPFILSVSVSRATGLKPRTRSLYLKDNQTLRRTRMQTAILGRVPCPSCIVFSNQTNENIIDKTKTNENKEGGEKKLTGRRQNINWQ